MLANATPIDVFIIGSILFLVFFIFWMGRQITPEDYPPDFSRVTSKVVCTQNGVVLKETVPFTIAYLFDVDPPVSGNIVIENYVYQLKEVSV